MPPRNPGRLGADLVVAAAALIERTGSVEAVTLRAVAREAGVTAPAVYGHFPDLGALLDAVLEEGFLALRAAIEASVAGVEDPVERLVTGCRAYVTAGRAAPARYRAMFQRPQPPGGRGAFDVLVDAVAACQEAGRSRSRDARGDALLVWTALHGVVTLQAAGKGAPDLDGRLRDLVARLALVEPVASGGDGPG